MLHAKRTRRNRLSPWETSDPLVTREYAAPAYLAPVDTGTSGGHPLADAAHDRRLWAREGGIRASFDAIAPALQEIASLPQGEEFAARAQSILESRLGVSLDAKLFASSWIAPLNTRRLYAHAVFEAFRALWARGSDRYMVDESEGIPADEAIRRWGFHAIDVTQCADGRLVGVADYILRVPAAITRRHAYAGAMFDVEESVTSWVEVEHRRYREGQPNSADEPTRYLKIGVYHFSSSDPSHEGCAAHGSDTNRAAQALLDRLKAFERAIENSFCCGASVATLLVGVDTDTDAIRVHVPDARGETSLHRYLDSRVLFDATAGMEREAAKEAIRAAVNDCAGDQDPASEGMRWLISWLLKNNMAQIAYVQRYHDGRYEAIGHSEKLITVGDSLDEVQLRNLAYQANMDTIEEGAADMDVGIKIFKKVNVAHGLPIPVVVHYRYDGRVPGSRERAAARCARVIEAIHARYPQLVNGEQLFTFAVVQDGGRSAQLETVEGAASPAG